MDLKDRQQKVLTFFLKKRKEIEEQNKCSASKKMLPRTQSFNQSQRIGSFDLSAQINSMQKRRRSVGFKFDIAEHVKVECIPKYLDGRYRFQNAQFER